MKGPWTRRESLREGAGNEIEQEVDWDGSGQIEFSEFQRLCQELDEQRRRWEETRSGMM